MAINVIREYIQIFSAISYLGGIRSYETWQMFETNRLFFNIKIFEN